MSLTLCVCVWVSKIVQFPPEQKKVGLSWPTEGYPCQIWIGLGSADLRDLASVSRTWARVDPRALLEFWYFIFNYESGINVATACARFRLFGSALPELVVWFLIFAQKRRKCINIISRLKGGHSGILSDLMKTGFKTTQKVLLFAQIRHKRCESCAKSITRRFLLGIAR